MNTRFFALLLAVGCGHSSSSPKPVSGTAEPAPAGTAPMDSLLADLEAMRPFVVVHDGKPDCAAYTPAASGVVAKIAAGTSAANDTRAKAAPDAVAQWQTAHAGAIEKLIAEVATPVRNVTDCEPMSKDETWTRVSFGIVAVAQPANPPPAVVHRRAVMKQMLDTAATIKSKDDCKPVVEQAQAVGPTLEQELDKMTPIERFVDDKVWEEEDEKQGTSSPGMKNLETYCGFN
jgi:hypothetical protein